MGVRHAKESPPWTVLALAGDIAVAIATETTAIVHGDQRMALRLVLFDKDQLY